MRLGCVTGTPRVHQKSRDATSSDARQTTTKASARRARVTRVVGASPGSRVVAPARADEAIVGIREEDVERGEAAVDARDVLLELEPVLVGQLRMAVDPLLEHAQLLAHGNQLAEEALDGDDLLLRARLARLEHQLPARPAVGDLAGHGLLGMEHGAHRLDDLADVFVLQHAAALARSARGRPIATRRERRPAGGRLATLPRPARRARSGCRSGPRRWRPLRNPAAGSAPPPARRRPRAPPASSRCPRRAATP